MVPLPPHLLNATSLPPRFSPILHPFLSPDHSVVENVKLPRLVLRRRGDVSGLLLLAGVPAHNAEGFDRGYSSDEGNKEATKKLNKYMTRRGRYYYTWVCLTICFEHLQN